MDPDRWRRVEVLYHSALEREPQQRHGFLTEVCDGDEDLRRLLEDLLSQNSATNALVGEPVWETVTDTTEPVNRVEVGTRLGPYEILGTLGEGGMGKVYRALDTRLDRAVAIKVCAEQFSARFEREARVIAALNHPHICTLYDVGANYLVMELVEGETLAQRIDRLGPFPLQDALEIGLQVTEALATAHSKGIVHRDLKPANIKISPERKVKVLDFGVAKTVLHERGSDDGFSIASAPSVANTIGPLVGTPAYMSPEQASGWDVDARTDVWAFGCLIYEILTGKRAFSGNDSAEIIACILECEPDWKALLPHTPAKIRVLLRSCLEKDAGRRLKDIRGARIEIRAAMQPGRTLRTALIAFSSALLVALAISIWSFREGNTHSDQMLHAVPLTSYLGSQDWPSFSPDGNQVAFSWDGEKQDNFDIYVKNIGPGPPLRLTHDRAADTAPAWSPDGKSIAFLRASRPGKAFVMLDSPRGSAERVVGEVVRFDPASTGLTWSPDGKWLVAFDRPPAQSSGLFLISVETGERRRLTTTPPAWSNSGDFSQIFAPDGRFLAFKRLLARNSFDLFLLPLGPDMLPRAEPNRLTRVSQVITGLAWSTDGRDLIFSSGSPGNVNLFRIAVAGGSAKPLTEQREILNLAVSARSHRLVFAQSRREMDIYQAELSNDSGEAHGSVPLIASSRFERYPSYSPDGKKIAFVSQRSGNWQLWVTDSDGENAVQMTSFVRGEVAFTAWSPDGRQIGFTSDAEGPQQGYVVDAATGGRPNKLDALGREVYSFRWTRDGRRIFFLSTRSGTLELWRIASTGGVPEQMTLQGASAPVVESADGTLVYYARPGGIWCVPVAGGPERELFKAEVDPGALEADRRGIYFLTNSSVTKNGALMFYRFPDGPITKVAGVQTRYGFSLSPTGHHLLYTKMTSSGSDLMLVDNFP